MNKEKILFVLERITESAEENIWGRKMFRPKGGAKIEKSIKTKTFWHQELPLTYGRGEFPAQCDSP